MDLHVSLTLFASRIDQLKEVIQRTRDQYLEYLPKLAVVINNMSKAAAHPALLEARQLHHQIATMTAQLDTLNNQISEVSMSRRVVASMTYAFFI